MNVILVVDYVTWQSPSIHLVPLYLFVVAGASPGCHCGREPRSLATVLLPCCLHWWVRGYIWELDSGSQIWTWCLLSIKLWRLMAACVSVFDTVLNTQDLIGFSVLWRCERLWLRSGPTLFFGNGPRRRRGEVKSPPGSMCTAWDAFCPWINTTACQYSGMMCVTSQWLGGDEKPWTASCGM